MRFGYNNQSQGKYLDGTLVKNKAMQVINVLERMLRIGALLDLYGAMLTEKQRRAVGMHFLDDLSLAEIGEALGVSRQAVHDIIHRAEASLEEYEQKLGFLQKRQVHLEKLTRLGEAIEALPPEIGGRVEIASLRKRFEELRGGFEEA